MISKSAEEKGYHMEKNPPKIYTIGYEGARAKDFLNTLKLKRISILVDIREVPSSRRAGFSKSALSSGLKQEGIHYLHLKALGDPKPGRVAAREGRFDDFYKIYTAHFASAKSQAAFRELLALVHRHTLCLLCYEREPSRCHRKIVSDEIFCQTGIKVQDLGIPEHSDEEWKGLLEKNKR